MPDRQRAESLPKLCFHVPNGRSVPVGFCVSRLRKTSPAPSCGTVGVDSLRRHGERSGAIQGSKTTKTVADPWVASLRAQ
jgi:hypothetical protein